MFSSTISLSNQFICFTNLIFCNNYVRFALLDLQCNINYLCFTSIFKFFNITCSLHLANLTFGNNYVCFALLDSQFNIN
jgi:hypothetical protein